MVIFSNMGVKNEVLRGALKLILKNEILRFTRSIGFISKLQMKIALLCICFLMFVLISYISLNNNIHEKINMSLCEIESILMFLAFILGTLKIFYLNFINSSILYNLLPLRKHERLLTYYLKLFINEVDLVIYVLFLPLIYFVSLGFSYMAFTKLLYIIITTNLFTSLLAYFFRLLSFNDFRVRKQKEVLILISIILSVFIFFSRIFFQFYTPSLFYFVWFIILLVFWFSLNNIMIVFIKYSTGRKIAFTKDFSEYMKVPNFATANCYFNMIKIIRFYLTNKTVLFYHLFIYLFIMISFITIKNQESVHFIMLLLAQILLGTFISSYFLPFSVAHDLKFFKLYFLIYRNTDYIKGKLLVNLIFTSIFFIISILFFSFLNDITKILIIEYFLYFAFIYPLLALLGSIKFNREYFDIFNKIDNKVSNRFGLSHFVYNFIALYLLPTILIIINAIHCYNSTPLSLIYFDNVNLMIISLYSILIIIVLEIIFFRKIMAYITKYLNNNKYEIMEGYND